MSDIISAKNRVILKPQPTQKNKSGLELPTADKDMPQIGVVYKMGVDKPPLPMKIGDTVVYEKYLTNRLYIPQLGEELDFIKYENICAVIPKKEND